MSDKSSHYVIGPIDGIHFDFDYHMYSAEIYGSPPNYKPYPRACAVFREPYELFGKLPFNGYERLIPKLISDIATIKILPDLPNRRMNEFTCLGFEIEIEDSEDLLQSEPDTREDLFKRVIERGEGFLDPLRLCIFKPGEHESAGKFGSVGNGIQCFWIGRDDGEAEFFARKSLRQTLIQQPIDILEDEFGPIYADITFRGLCSEAFKNPIDRNVFHGRLLRAVKSFRQSRDIQSPEARFRQLAAIAEELAKFKEEERVSGPVLRNRIAKISSTGWSIYEHYNDSVLGSIPVGKNSQLLRDRYREIGWENDEDAQRIIKELWDNVRNPFSHSLETFESLERDENKDIANAERIVVTMINGWYAAYQVEELYDKPIEKILMDEDK